MINLIAPPFNMTPSNTALQSAVQTGLDLAIAIAIADSSNSSVGQPVVAPANRASVEGLPKAWIKRPFEEISDEAFDQLVAEASSPSCTYQMLDLRYGELGDKKVIKLAHALEKNQSVTELNLRKNKIGNRGAKALSELLVKASTLRKIVLCQNDLEWGLLYLAKALKSNDSLIAIELDENNVDDDGIEALAEALKINRGLKSLSLHGNLIGSCGAGSLGEAFAVNQSLTFVDLSHCGIAATDCANLLKGLAHNTVLEELDLSRNPLESCGFKSLRSALDGNKLHFKTLSVSCGVHYTEPSILAGGLQANRTLKTLILDATLDDAGMSVLVDALKKNRTLTSLDLSKTTLRRNALRIFADLFSKNETICSLKLNVALAQSDAGNEIKRFARINRHLVSLDLLTRGMTAGRSGHRPLPAQTVPTDVLKIIAGFIDEKAGPLV